MPQVYPWTFAFFSKADGSPIETVEDIAETVARSARMGEGTKLWGVTGHYDGEDRVICYTGNGPRSEAHARLVSCIPWFVKFVRETKALMDPSPAEEDPRNLLLQIDTVLECADGLDLDWDCMGVAVTGP